MDIKVVEDRLKYAERRLNEAVENTYPVAEVRYWAGQRDALRGIKEEMEK